MSYYKYVTPNADPGPGHAPFTNNYQTLQVENDLWRSAMVKLDYNLSSSDKFTIRWGGQGRWISVNTNIGYPSADPANGNGKGAQPLSHNGAVQWTHVFSPTVLF